MSEGSFLAFESGLNWYSTVAVKPDQTITNGETLFTIEVMKMKLAIKAEKDCVVQEVLLGTGK